MAGTLRVHDASGIVTWQCELPEAGLVIGRDPTCDLNFDDPSLSRRHAQVWASAQSVHLRDLGSANGSWVEGQRVTQIQIPSGQAFRLGNMNLSVEVSSDPRVARTLYLEGGETAPAWSPPVPASPAAASTPTPVMTPAPPPEPTPEPASTPLPPPPAAAQLEGRRRWGRFAAALLVGFVGSAGLLFATGWIEDSLKLYEGEAPATSSSEAVAALPEPQAWPEAGTP